MASHLTGSTMGKPPKVLESSKFKVRRDVVETTQDIIPTNTSLPCHQDRSLHFKIDPAANKCLNLSLMKLHLKYKVVDKNKIGAATTTPSLPDDYANIIPGNPLASMFKDVKIKLNGTPVSDSSDLYPWISKHLYLTKVPPVYRRATEVSGRMYYDYEQLTSQDYFKKSNKEKKVADGHVTEFTEEQWQDMATRRSRDSVTRTKGAVDLCNYLVTDLTSAPTPVVLPPDVTVEIELLPNSPGRTILSTHSELDKGPNPVVEIVAAELIVPRILPNGSAIPTKVTHQFMAVDAQPIFIPAGSTNYHGVVTFPGTLPSRLSVLMIDRDGYDGNHRTNMYNSQANNIESITFNAGGTQFPSAPLTANPSRGEVANMYLRTAESLRFSLDKTQMTLPKTLSEYRFNDFLYSADISSDYSADSTWTTRPEQGSVVVSMHFTKPTMMDIVAIVLSESVATLSIDKAQVNIIK